MGGYDKAFVEWQEERTNVNRHREYVTQCKQVKCDRELWWVSLLPEMENDMRQN